MRFLLDTNILLALYRGASRELVRSRLAGLGDGEAGTSVVVAHELYFGAAKSRRPDENRAHVALLLQDLPVLELSRNDAAVAGVIRAWLDAAGMRIGAYDVLLAGQAKARGLVLVTNNMRAFRRVEGLEVADWLGA